MNKYILLKINKNNYFNYINNTETFTDCKKKLINYFNWIK